MRRLLLAASALCALAGPVFAAGLDTLPVVSPAPSDKICGYTNAAGHAAQCSLVSSIPFATVINNTSANTTDGTVTTANTTQQILRLAAPSGAGNEFAAFDSIEVPSGHGGGGTTPYEVAARYSNCRTADSNTGGASAYDCVGANDVGITQAGDTLARVWGANCIASVVASSDALAIGCENSVNNSSTNDQAAFQTTTSKIANYATSTGTGHITAFGYGLASSAGATAHFGWAVDAASLVTGAPAFAVMGGTTVGSETAAFYQDGHAQVTYAHFIPTTKSGLSTADPSPADGDRAYITDAVSCSFNGTVSGGGTTRCPVHYDSTTTSWKAG